MLLLALGLLGAPQAMASSAGCPLPRELGATTWFLASMQSVDLCTLLRPPNPNAGESPTVVPSPVPAEHVVAEGETLSAIARRYGTTVEVLRQLNDLDEADVLSIGMVLRLPAEEQTPAGTPAFALRPREGCHPEVLEKPLDLPYEPIRIAAYRGVLYLLAGGQLYALPEGDLAQPGPAEPLLIAPRDRRVGPIPVQELVDLVVDETAGELVLLDKAGDLFAYQPLTARWSVRMVAQRLPEVWLDPQYLTVTVLDGVAYGLDVDGARLWRMSADASRPVMALERDYLARAVDLTAWNGELFLLDAGGALKHLDGRFVELGIRSLAWPADLGAAGGNLLAVDADGRRVLVIDEQGGLDITLVVPGMRRLRSATLSGRTLYAVAGPVLYRLDLDAPVSDCPPPVYDDRFLFHGLDLRELPTFQLPFAGGVLPDRPRSYPGARRLYRYGIHEGVDFYQGDAPGLRYGSPVGAIADGIVVRIDHDFREMTPAEYVVVMNEIYALHSTPAHSLDKLRGQQVWVEHAPGIVSRYAHLASVAANLQVGDRVTAGQRLGTVGVSGTSSGVYGSQDGYHLHWELWIHDHYLGFGLTLRETMRLWRQLF